MGLLNVCLAFVTFCRDRRPRLSALSYLIDFARTVEDACPYKMLFVQADMSETVRRSLPRLIALRLSSSVLDRLAANMPLPFQNFDSVISQPAAKFLRSG